MKARLLISVLTISMVIVANITNVCAYMPVSGPSSMKGQGEVPFTPQALLDNFNAANGLNAWNCITGTFSKSTVIPTPSNEKCTASYVNTTGVAYEGYSLKLDYDVSQTSSFDGKPTYAGYYSIMKGPAGGGSLTGYTAVSFYVKGSAGNEFFKVQLKNSSVTGYWSAEKSTHYQRNMSSVYVTDFLPAGNAITTSWQKVTIPLHNFANLDGVSSMLEFAILFENAQSIANKIDPLDPTKHSPTSGTIYIDNIMFETNPVTIVKVDLFGDMVGTCALGGNLGTASANGTISAAFSNNTNEFSPYKNGLSLTYNVTGVDAWAAAYLIFGGGNVDETVTPPVVIENKNEMGWIAIPHDFSAYTKLTFRVRARSATENPVVLIVEAKDDVVTKSVTVSPVLEGWGLATINLTSFTGLNKSKIRQLTFTLQGNTIGVYGGDRAGTIFIDAVQFEQ